MAKSFNDTFNKSRNGLTTFVNVRTDFGFKQMFGTEKNKRLVIRLLNALFGEEIRITDIQYHDKEILPADENGKRIIYDIYFTSKVVVPKKRLKPQTPLVKNPVVISIDDEKEEAIHHFILEMQNVYEPPFEDRVLYYTAKPIASQGQRGWQYTLDPVVTLLVTNFDFSHMSEKLVRYIGIADVETGEVFSDKLRIISLSLKQMANKDWNDCNTEIEEIIYLICNMDKLDKNSEAYKSKRYEDFFEAAETDDFVQEEAVAYSQSLERLYAAEAGVRYAMEQGFQQGIQQGVRQTIRESVRLMSSVGVSKNLIADKFNLTIEDIDDMLCD